MIVQVIVKTNRNEDLIVFDPENNVFLISVKDRALKGEANRAVISLLSSYLNIPKSKIILKSGSRSRVKLFEY